MQSNQDDHNQINSSLVCQSFDNEAVNSTAIDIIEEINSNELNIQ